jgi:type II secretory pathway predicted ATPase ExeA
MKNRNLQALYGLKWNPFAKEVPTHALKIPPQADRFLWQIEQLAFDGGFALLSGVSGYGKSAMMRIIKSRLAAVGGICVAQIDRPQSSLRDFYIELSEAFGIVQKGGNRYGGFKRLRAEWLKQISAASFRPFLLVDEAQAAPTEVLSELQILGSHEFDSRCILAVVLAGDQRLPARLRENESLIPIDTRIKTKMILEKQTCEELVALLSHALAQSGAPDLMTLGLKTTIAEQANGSPRTLMNIASDLLLYGAEKESTRLDEHLLLDFDGTKLKQRSKLPRPNLRG